jgi:hypothetical protein
LRRSRRHPPEPAPTTNKTLPAGNPEPARGFLRHDEEYPNSRENRMTNTAVLDAEAAFFMALLAADRAALDTVLAHDFLLVGVGDGQIVARAVLLDLVGSRDLEFLEIDWNRRDVLLRNRPAVAVAIGHTRMTMRFQGTTTTVHSRYVHTYVNDGDQWQLLTAQGTPTAGGSVLSPES